VTNENTGADAQPITTAQRFTLLFSGLRRAYGSYTLDGRTTAKGKRQGKAVTEAKQLDDAHYEKHLTTAWTLGVVPIRDDQTCTFGALDIDVYQGLDHKAVVARIQRLDLPLVAVRSKSGGLHLYAFVSEPVQAGEVQRVLRTFAVALGFPTCEIFPKQHSLQPDEVGNWINLPYQGALVPGGYGTERYGYDDSGAPLAELGQWLDYAEGKRIGATSFNAIEINEPRPARTRRADPQSKFDGPPCLEHAIADRITEGGRDNMLYQAAIFLREKHGFSTDDLDEMLTLLTKFNGDYCDPPHDFKDVRRIARQALKPQYFYKCKDQPMASLCDKAACVRRQFGVGSRSADGRPTVELREGQQPAALAALREQLIAHPDLEVVVYAETLTHPYLKPAKTYGGREAEVLALNRLTPAALASKLNKIVHFVRVRAKEVTVDCPPQLVAVFMALPEEWRGLARVDRIAETPIFRDGSLLSTPGHCAQAHAWINAPAGIELPAVCDRTAADDALARVREWLQEFPFDTPTDEAVAVCALLTAAMRASLPHAPGVLIDKPDFGSGASTLGSLIGIVLTGKLPAVITLAGGREAGEETRKHIDAVQLEGGAGLFFDNLPKGRAFKSIPCAQVLSEPERNVRVLGQTRGVTVPCTQMVVMTGVNVGVAADLVRRFMRCRLDPRCERPQERAFTRPTLLADAQRERAQLLTDLYTIAAAYVRSGERVEGTRLNGYEQWTAWCQQPLLWLGMADPVLSARKLEAEDEDVMRHAALLDLWAAAWGGEPKTVAEVLATAALADTPAARLRDSLLGMIHDRETESLVNRLVGLKLREFNGKVADGMRLVSTDTQGGRVAARWRLERLDGGIVESGDDREERERAAEREQASTTGVAPVSF
jgi:hypothetical protein